MTHARPSGDRQPCVAQPTLRDLFEDPLIDLLMASDGVEPRRLWNLLMAIAERRARSRDAGSCFEPRADD
jgi:hypothetical protein